MLKDRAQDLQVPMPFRGSKTQVSLILRLCWFQLFVPMPMMYAQYSHCPSVFSLARESPRARAPTVEPCVISLSNDFLVCVVVTFRV